MKNIQIKTMTNKQIIDGIDVSKCCHQDKNNTCTCPHYKKECGKNPNCHYKIMQRQTKKLDKFYKKELELKQNFFRKEQECEMLKQLNCIYSIGIKQANELKETLDHKQAYINNIENYNEQLNKQLDQLKANREEENIQSKTLYKCKKCNNKLQLINIKLLYRHNRDNDLYSLPESLSQSPTHIWAHYQCSTCGTTHYIEYNLEQISIQEVIYEL